MLPNLRAIQAFRKRILAWFKHNDRAYPWRRSKQSAYRLIASELLLQRTRADSVSKIYHKFFEKYPSWKSIAHADEADLSQFLRPLGLWRRRVNVLIALARYVHSRRDKLPNRRVEIEQLPGIGQYIANAIELIGFGIPRPLLDVNMARVLERYFGPRDLADIRYDPYLTALAQRVVDCEQALLVNWAILDLGGLICISRNPRCDVCPLAARCNYAKGISRAKNDPVA